MQNFVELQKCLKEIETKLGWGDREKGTNHEFNKLSTAIFEMTKISISVSSLRRLYGKSTSYKKIYNPQIETKNALAAFIGYKNWADYLSNNEKSTPSKREKKPKTLYIILLFFTGIVISTILFLKNNDIENQDSDSSTSVSKKKYDLSKITFKGKHLFGEDVPHTVTIEYDVNEYPNDDFYIDFGILPPDGSEPPKPLKLDNEKHIITNCYNYKSSFVIRLLDANHNTLKSVKAYIHTNGWEGYIQQNQLNLKFDSFQLFDEGLMKSPMQMAINKGIDTNKVFRTFLRDIRNFDVSCDAMEVEIRFKSKFRDGYVECNHIQFEFTGAQNRHFITIMTPGCDGQINVIDVGEKRFNGRQNDLNTLAIDTRSWKTLRLRVEKQTAEYFVDDLPVFSSGYNTQIGPMKGIRFEFRGQGFIDYITIKNLLTGKVIYDCDF
jgi:hypothetical protein